MRVLAGLLMQLQKLLQQMVLLQAGIQSPSVWMLLE
jgi:hypothetical protein